MHDTVIVSRQNYPLWETKLFVQSKSQESAVKHFYKINTKQGLLYNINRILELDIYD